MPAVVKTVIDSSAANTSGVSVELRGEHEPPDAAVAADELADDRTDERERERDLQRVGDVRHCVHQPDQPEHPIRRSAGEAREVEDVGLDLAEPRQRVDEDGKQGEQEREQDLGLRAEPEPDDEQRRDRDLRDAVERGEERHDDALERRAAQIFCSSNAMRSRVITSSAPNGSSIRISGGSSSSARQMAARCCMPPES